jgi:hypothetical protein
MVYSPLRRLGGSLSFLVLCSVLSATPLKIDYSPGTHPIPGRPQQSTTYGHFHHVPYDLSDQNWDVWLQPDPPDYISSFSAGGMATLQAAFPDRGRRGWTFENATRPLSDGSLIVHTYKAWHANRSAGAEFFVEYDPQLATKGHPGDPQTNIHWIQVVSHLEVPQTKVDNGGARNPYYDTKGTADDTFFWDEPFGGDWIPHDWVAELLLVQGVGRDVTILGGIKWGWENACLAHCGMQHTPEPATWALLLGGLLLCTVRHFLTGHRRLAVKALWRRSDRAH